MACRPRRVFTSFSRLTTAPPHPSFVPYRSPALHKPIALASKLPVRPASQWVRGPRPKYSRFSRVEGLYALWRTSPAFRIGLGLVGVAGGIFYFANIEYVPVTGRRRFNFISPEQEASLAEEQYKAVMQEYDGKVLPPDHPYSRAVVAVAARLLPASGLQDQQWEVRVINDPSVNAFVMPGGKIFVFSGILPVCAGNDGLAHVLGHEIAHSVAHHTAEKLSKSGFILGLALVIALTFDISGHLAQSVVDIALSRTNSRTQESEADHIGLLIASKACYDPQAAIGLWQRMTKAEQYAPPQFLSTHPASANRIVKLQGWLPEAEAVRWKSECGSTIGFGKVALCNLSLFGADSLQLPSLETKSVSPIMGYLSRLNLLMMTSFDNDIDLSVMEFHGLGWSKVIETFQAQIAPRFNLTLVFATSYLAPKCDWDFVGLLEHKVMHLGHEVGPFRHSVNKSDLPSIYRCRPGRNPVYSREQKSVHRIGRQLLDQFPLSVPPPDMVFPLPIPRLHLFEIDDQPW